MTARIGFKIPTGAKGARLTAPISIPSNNSSQDSNRSYAKRRRALLSSCGEQSPLFSKGFPKKNAKLISQTQATPNLIEKCSSDAKTRQFGDEGIKVAIGKPRRLAVDRSKSRFRSVFLEFFLYAPNHRQRLFTSAELHGAHRERRRREDQDSRKNDDGETHCNPPQLDVQQLPKLIRRTPQAKP